MVAGGILRPCWCLRPVPRGLRSQEHPFCLISAHRHSLNLHFVTWSSRSWCMLLLNSNIFGLLGIAMYYPRLGTFRLICTLLLRSFWPTVAWYSNLMNVHESHSGLRVNLVKTTTISCSPEERQLGWNFELFLSRPQHVNYERWCNFPSKNKVYDLIRSYSVSIRLIDILKQPRLLIIQGRMKK